MNKLLALATCVLLFACNQKIHKTENTNAATEQDPHSFSQPDKAVGTHLDLDIKVDFSTQQISGKAVWIIDNKSKGSEIIFDTRKLQIEKVTVGDD